jgi:hypothetical protein
MDKRPLGMFTLYNTPIVDGIDFGNLGVIRVVSWYYSGYMYQI